MKPETSERQAQRFAANLVVRAKGLMLDERHPEEEARELLKDYAASIAREYGVWNYNNAVHAALNKAAIAARGRYIRPRTAPAASPQAVEAEIQTVVPARIEQPALTRETVGDRVYYGIAPTPPPPAGPPPAVLQAAKAAGDAFRRAVGRARTAPPPEPPPGPAPEVRAKAGRFVRDLKRAETAQRQAR